MASRKVFLPVILWQHTFELDKEELLFSEHRNFDRSHVHEQVLFNSSNSLMNTVGSQSSFVVDRKFLPEIKIF